jgi:hypothetical protein
MSATFDGERGGIKMSALFEVSFTSQDGATGINELLPASGFEDAQSKAVRLAGEKGLVVAGIIRSPWRVITEFVEFV